MERVKKVPEKDNEKLAAPEIDAKKAKKLAIKQDKANRKRNAAEKAEKVGFFKRIFRGIKRWVNELRSEAKKVTWPTFKQVVNNSLIVFAMILIVGVIIWVADLGLRNGLQMVIELF